MGPPNLPSCESCQQWLYDADWKQSTRGGKPNPRPAGVPPPCWKCPKSHDGKPNPGAELSDKNWRAIEYAHQCFVDGLGLLPQDRLTVRNNALVKRLEDRLGQQQATNSMIEWLSASLGGGKLRGR